MKALQIAATKNTPEVIFDASSTTLSIQGRSYPEDAKAFYDPILEWMGEIEQADMTQFNLVFELSYISSSSLIPLLDIVKWSKSAADSGVNVGIVWRYEDDDEDIQKAGEDFARIAEIPIELVAFPAE